MNRTVSNLQKQTTSNENHKKSRSSSQNSTPNKNNHEFKNKKQHLCQQSYRYLQPHYENSISNIQETPDVTQQRIVKKSPQPSFDTQTRPTIEGVAGQNRRRSSFACTRNFDINDQRLKSRPQTAITTRAPGVVKKQLSDASNNNHNNENSQPLQFNNGQYQKSRLGNIKVPNLVQSTTPKVGTTQIGKPFQNSDAVFNQTRNTIQLPTRQGLLDEIKRQKQIIQDKDKYILELEDKIKFLKEEQSKDKTERVPSPLQEHSPKSEDSIQNKEVRQSSLNNSNSVAYSDSDSGSERNLSKIQIAQSVTQQSITQQSITQQSITQQSVRNYKYNYQPFQNGISRMEPLVSARQIGSSRGFTPLTQISLNMQNFKNSGKGKQPGSNVDEYINKSSSWAYMFNAENQQSCRLRMEARKLQNVGTQLFQEQKFSEAQEQYGKAIDIFTNNQIKDANQELSNLCCSRAAALINQKKLLGGIQDCFVSLAYQPKYFRALRSRAEALACVGELRLSLQDVEQAYELEPCEKLKAKMDILRKKIASCPQYLANYYLILDVPTHATIEHIKAAYRDLVLLYHPDKNRNRFFKEANDFLIKIINQAYNTLSDQSRRQTYDKQMYKQKAIFKKSLAQAQ